MSTKSPKDAWSASRYNASMSCVYSDSYVQAVFDLLAPKLGERIMDMGCGTGELTFRLQTLVGEAGFVVGVDASESMLKKAVENGVKNAFCCDVQDFAFPDEYKYLSGTFDSVFSNATLHWCKRDPRAVVRAVKDILKPGGKFVGEFGGDGHCVDATVGVRSALHQVLKRRGIDATGADALYHPRPEQYAKLLESEGFTVEHISLNPRITPLPGPLTDFVRAIMRGPMLSMLSDEEAEIAVQEVSDFCEPDLKDENGGWSVMWVGLRFRATSTRS